MNPDQGRKIVVLAVALVAVAALFALIEARGHLARTQRLPDGSYLRIVSVEYGHSHSYTSTAPKPWQAFLARHMPAAWTSRLGWWTFHGGSVGGSARPGETNLAVITICEQATPASFNSRFAKLAVSDLQGQSYGTARASSAGLSEGTHRRQLGCWMLPTTPREARQLRLQFLELGSDGTTWQPVAEFIVPNPACAAAESTEKAGVH